MVQKSEFYAAMAMKNGEWKKALSFLNDTAKGYWKDGRMDDYILAMGKKAVCMFWLGKREKSLEYLDLCIDYWGRQCELGKLLFPLDKKSNFLMMMDRHRDAVPLIRRAIDVRRVVLKSAATEQKLAVRRGLGISLLTYCRCQSKLEKLEDVLEFSTEAIGIGRDIEDKHILKEALDTKAMCLMHIGSYKEAVAYWDACVRMHKGDAYLADEWKRRRLLGAIAYALSRKARCLMKLGSWKMAVKVWDEFIDARKGLKMPGEVSLGFQKKAECFSRDGDYQNAKKAIEAAVSNGKQDVARGYSLSLAFDYLSAAKIYAKLGDEKKVEESILTGLSCMVESCKNSGRSNWRLFKDYYAMMDRRGILKFGGSIEIPELGKSVEEWIRKINGIARDEEALSLYLDYLEIRYYWAVTVKANGKNLLKYKDNAQSVVDLAEEFLKQEGAIRKSFDDPGYVMGKVREILEKLKRRHAEWGEDPPFEFEPISSP